MMHRSVTPQTVRITAGGPAVDAADGRGDGDPGPRPRATQTGAPVSAVLMAVPVASRRGDLLRPLTQDAVTLLRAAGVDLARAATAAEQALALAVGVRSPWPTRPATSATAPAHPIPAPPGLRPECDPQVLDWLRFGGVVV